MEWALVEGQVDQHRTEAPLTVEKTLTKSPSCFMDLGAGAGEGTRSGKDLGI